MLDIQDKVHKYAALSILLLLIYLFAALLILPIIRQSQITRLDYESTLQTLEKFTKKVMKSKHAELENKTLSEALNQNEAVLFAKSYQNAQKQLQQRFLQIAQMEGAQIMQIENIESHSREKHKRVTISAKISLNNQKLAVFLGSLETGKPHIAIDKLAIESKGTGSSLRSQQQPVRLNITLLASAFWVQQ